MRIFLIAYFAKNIFLFHFLSKFDFLLCQALEAPREPRRPKTHWDHVLEEMVWLSKVSTSFTLKICNIQCCNTLFCRFCLLFFVLQDFESERKWKLAQAKKVALRASKGMLDQATRGEKKMKVLISLL